MYTLRATRFPSVSQVPADMVLLKTSDPEGSCYIQSTNLDGEAELKVRRAMDATRGMSDTQIAAFLGVVVCSPPSSLVNAFTGSLFLPSRPEVPIPLEHDHLLLACTQLKHSDYVFGAVIYTGESPHLPTFCVIAIMIHHHRIVATLSTPFGT